MQPCYYYPTVYTVCQQESHENIATSWFIFKRSTKILTRIPSRSVRYCANFINSIFSILCYVIQWLHCNMWERDISSRLGSFISVWTVEGSLAAGQGVGDVGSGKTKFYFSTFSPMLLLRILILSIFSWEELDNCWRSSVSTPSF